MDWYVLLTPLLLLPIVSLLVFVGCELEKHGALASNEPGPLEGIPVTIYLSASLQQYVDHFEFWCWREDGHETMPHVIATNSDIGQGVAPQFMLDAPFLADSSPHCWCRGLITWKKEYNNGTTWSVNESPRRDFPINTPLLDFGVKWKEDSTGAPSEFSLYF
jgi:hypothetical protein